MKGLMLISVILFWMVGCNELQVSYTLENCIEKDLLGTKPCELAQSGRNILNMFYAITSVIFTLILAIAVIRARVTSSHKIEGETSKDNQGKDNETIL